MPFGLKLLLVCFTVLIAGTGLLWFVPNITIGTFELRPWLLWLFFGTAYIALSWRFLDPIPPDERAVRVLLGYPTDTMSSGPPFLPLGFFTRIPITNLVTQRELPGEPKQLYRGEVKTVEETEALRTKGWVLPLRITFGDAVIYEAQAKKRLDYEYDGAEDADGRKIPFNPHVSSDGLSLRLTQEVSLVIRFRIVDGVSFVQNIGDLDSAVKQIEDEMVGVLNKRFPLISVSQALQNLGWINAILYRSVIRRTQKWGIEIEPNGAYVKAIGLNHSLNKAIADQAEADYQAKATVRTSEGQQTRLINEGVGNAQAAQDLVRGEIVGRAEGLTRLTQDLGITGAEAVAAEVAQTFGNNGNTTIIDSKTGIAGLAGAAASLFNSRRPPAAPAAPATPSSGQQQPPQNGGNNP